MRIITSSEQAKAIPGYLIDGFDSDDSRRQRRSGILFAERDDRRKPDQRLFAGTFRKW